MPFDEISAGLDLLFQAGPLAWLLLGVTLGFVVGVLPGLSTSNTAALLLPFSIGLPLESSLVLIVSIYAGAAFGGAVPAILVNVPGETGSAVTALDGYPMAKRGEGGYAIGIARMASVLGGVISGIVVLLVLEPLGGLALKFGAREMFVVILLGFVVASSIMGSNVRKGILAGVLGLLLATVGASPLTAQNRFTFDILDLYEGIPFLPALIGAFAISEMLLLAGSKDPTKPGGKIVGLGGIRQQLSDALRGVKTTLAHPVAVLRASSIGMFLGVIPGVGTSIANFVSYGLAKRQSKEPEQFGKGEPKGVIASEACDNAVTSATLVPTLTLGIPGSATMAVVLAAFYLQGIAPGPRVLVTNSAEVYAVVLALLVASLLILPLGILLAAPLTQISRMPISFLVPGVVFVSLAGAFASRSSLFDVALTVIFGVVAYIMRLHGYPVIPLILGLILGPLAEEYLLRGLTLGNDQMSYFFDSAVVNVLWFLLAAMVVYLVVSGRRDAVRRRRRAEGSGPAGPQLLEEPADRRVSTVSTTAGRPGPDGVTGERPADGASPPSQAPDDRNAP
ncbi:tripartite tricarboxylate transporter permease [Blastococcus saxobsidens]|uniref:Putative tricarboxylic transport membrane protein n=1 Tax=Blastococcus saxobsidens TaxID=138336 RepID=A0A4Q7YAE7_9ACTN|nr:tripartite tricarboxylate transporter permease [Blastococcus saxobsidens]RZU34162.1 putative tricarboxylic transport membrane protein [Blastococcus saxobsidens]